jgi:7,8-dihydroneopterin aldolase/epimerase/oxygenase
VTDLVSVRDLSVRAVIGVHAWERDVEQTLLVSVDMVPETTDVRKAAASDDLADELDYSAVAETIAAVLRDGKFRLIETAAERVAERLLADFRLPWLRLELRKPITSPPQVTSSVTPAPAPGIPQSYIAVVTIERTRDPEGFSTP